MIILIHLLLSLDNRLLILMKAYLSKWTIIQLIMDWVYMIIGESRVI